MSKGDRDGRGFRHHKTCPSLNCDRCVNGRSKLPYRRAMRRKGKQEIRAEASNDLLRAGNATLTPMGQ